MYIITRDTLILNLANNPFTYYCFRKLDVANAVTTQKVIAANVVKRVSMVIRGMEVTAIKTAILNNTFQNLTEEVDRATLALILLDCLNHRIIMLTKC